MYKKFLLISALLALITLAVFAAQWPNGRALAQATAPDTTAALTADVDAAFTYQGFLQQNDVLIDGSCDFEFILYNAVTDGVEIGRQTRSGTAVSQGRFTVELNFGPNAFNGQARWLEISVRCPAGSGSFITLEPRQSLTAAPYAQSLQPGAAIHGDAAAPEGIVNIINEGDGSGVRIRSATDGFVVESAVTNGMYVIAATNGLRVGAVNTGVLVNSATKGVQVNSASIGVQVDAAGTTGVLVDTVALGSGFQVNSASEDGLFVCATGSQTDCENLPLKNGVEVSNAENYGFWVTKAGNDGVFIEVTGDDGMQIVNAGDDGIDIVEAGNDGVQVRSAVESGVKVETADIGFRADSSRLGLLVDSAVNGVQVNAVSGVGVRVGSAVDGVFVAGPTTNFAGFFTGNVQVTGTCTGCILATMAVNTGSAALEPGDVVALQGSRTGATVGQALLMEVGRATVGAPLVGVVYGRGELVTNAGGPDGQTVTQIAPRAGAAQPGDYVHIVLDGPAQVKADALSGSIALGEMLTVAESGAPRALKRVEVEGVQLAESAPTIGMALEGLTASDDGLIWVLVNPQ